MNDETTKPRKLGLGMYIPELVCLVSVPRPQTAQNCRSYNFNSRIKFLTEMYFSHQHLSIGLQKSLPRPQTAHKNLKKIVNMNADISETIKDREMGFKI